MRAVLKKDYPPYFDNFAWLEKVWSDGDNTFYVGQYQDVEASMDKYREVMGDFYPEFEDIYRDKESLLSALTFRAPVWPKDLSIGDVFRFETTDLDGNPVDSETLFAESKVTMANIWGTWCSPCRRELPDLALMAKEFESRGYRVIGICNDAYKEGKIEKVKDLLKDAGVEYPNLVGSPEIDDLFHVSSFPATYFVDSEGRLLLEPIFGTDFKGYRRGVEQALTMVE